MNRGVLQNSPVQQMMAAGNPSLWNINNLMRPPFISSPNTSSSTPTNFLAPPPNHHNHHHNHINNELFHAQYNNMSMSTPSSSSWLDDNNHHHPSSNNTTTNNQDQHQLPESWSQLILGGVILGEEAKKTMERWEEQLMLQEHHPNSAVDVKQESSVDSYDSTNNHSNVYTHEQEFHQLAANKAATCTNWSPQMSIPASSPQSCVTTFSSNNNMLDFSSKTTDNNLHSTQPLLTPDHSSECNSTAIGGAHKKAKVQPPLTQTTFKVRKEKLGDRITALHQLVSPFGKTDTASVLLEAIGYIRFLQSQVEALSLPYLSNGVESKSQPQSVQVGRKCIFPEDPGQLLDGNGLKRKGVPDQVSYEEPKDLRSRGLCLVPLSCTLQVGSDNGADYWAPAFGGGFR